MNPQVDALIAQESQWRAEFARLRALVLAAAPALAEEVKWGQPCYALAGRNVVLIHGFKDYCALLFIQGALLADPAGLLVQQTANVQAGRQLRFTGLAQIDERAAIVQDYVRAAAELARSGRKVELKKPADYPVPPEFQARLDADPGLRSAFEALTPGRRKGYLFYFAQAKQSATRESRIDKCLPKIFDGLGLDD
jgi:uncharacterized protein YdeI (YjbR/CyaY-like superfamily)